MPENLKEVQGLFNELDKLKEKLHMYGLGGLPIGRIVAEINTLNVNYDITNSSFLFLMIEKIKNEENAND